ncbi:MAG: hypothetical protein AB7D27_12845 [Desulfomicrobium sp.]
MNFFEKIESRKNTKISFRTDDETLFQLKAICRIENKTISSLIENILTDYILIHQNPLQTEQEKRLSPRKKCAIPTVIFSKTDSNLQSKGMIISLSSNSAQVVLKKILPEEIINNDIYILFELPKIDHQFLVNCTIYRHKCLDSECILILNFEIQNEIEEKIVQNFLDKNEYTELLDA